MYNKTLSLYILIRRNKWHRITRLTSRAAAFHHVTILHPEIEMNFWARFSLAYLLFWIRIALLVMFTHWTSRCFHVKINLSWLVRLSFYSVTLIQTPIYCLRVRWHGVYGVFYCFKTTNKADASCSHVASFENACVSATRSTGMRIRCYSSMCHRHDLVRQQ